MSRPPTPEADFYIGYRAQAPAGLARFYRRAAALLLLSAAGLGALLAGLMRPLPSSFFDFGNAHDYEGLVQEAPYPSLLVTDGLRLAGSAPQAATLPRVLLGGEGKQGAQDLVRGLDGARVRLTGTLAWRPSAVGAGSGPQGLIEVRAGSVQVLTPAGAGGSAAPHRASGAAGSAAGRGASGRRIQLSGEIMDAKCYLGVMNPGESTVHRDCAALCIRGGLPALFVARDGGGSEIGLLLVDEGGRAMADLLPPLVGLPLTLEGELVEAGGGFAELRVSRRDLAARTAARAASASAFPLAAMGVGWWCRAAPVLGSAWRRGQQARRPEVH